MRPSVSARNLLACLNHLCRSCAFRSGLFPPPFFTPGMDNRHTQHALEFTQLALGNKGK
jgi:hypothetical protein